MYVGFHLCINAKSFSKYIIGAFTDFGGSSTAFQVFIKNPRGYATANIPNEEVKLTREFIEKNGILLVSHAAYILNCASKDKWDKKLMTAIDDIMTIDSLGGIGSVFHVGKYLKLDISEATDNMREFIVKVVSDTGKIGCKADFILETAAGQGTECLVDLKEFGKFFLSIDAETRKRVKVCIDTCHVFAAGYELSDEKSVKEFYELVNEYIGWENVALIHLNNSKCPLGSRKDRHENLTEGLIGCYGLKLFAKMCHEMFIPLVTETPCSGEGRKQEMKMLNQWISK